MSLPVLVSARAPRREALTAPGGFVWWYVDLVDEAGDGAVVIFGWGLPFLPGYATAARGGRPERPIDRPAVSVAVFRSGSLAFWTLTEIPAATVTWEGDEVRSAAGTLRVSTDRGLRVRAELSGDLRGTRWTARLAVDGPLRVPDPGEPAHDPHEWSVLSCGGLGALHLEFGGRAWTVAGRAYVDRNAGEAPLEQVSGPWHWGRLALSGRDRVWYAEAGQNVGRTLEIDEVARELGPPAVEVWRAGRWGQMFPGVVSWPDGQVVLEPVDDSPFYVRFLARGRVGGAACRGIAEYCVPARIDAAWMRPLVRMAVRPADRAGSRWLPLLSGPTEGRWERTIRGWLR
jgi:hypothetical protein